MKKIIWYYSFNAKDVYVYIDENRTIYINFLEFTNTLADVLNGGKVYHHTGYKINMPQKFIDKFKKYKDEILAKAQKVYLN